MKFKAVLVLTAALSFGGALAQTAAAPAPVAPALTDVPAGHWAKDAVDLLVSKGIIIGFPDGTFRGSETLTRYQAALMIQRLLDMMATSKGPVLNPEELDTIRNAVQELASDLAALGVRVSDLEDKAVSKDDFATLQDTVSGFDSTVSDLSAQVDAKAAQADLDTLSGRVDDLEATVSDSAAAMEELSATVSDLGSQVGDLSGRVDDLEASLGDTQAGLEEVQGNLATAQESIDGLSAKDEELQAAIDELSGKLDDTTATAEDALSQAQDLQAKYDEIAGSLADLGGTVDDLSSTVDDNTASIEANAAAIADNAAAIADLSSMVDDNTAAIADLSSMVDDNTAGIEANSAAIADLSSMVDDNTAAIEANTAAIADLTSVVDDNTTGIEANSAAIADLSSMVDDNTAAIEANAAAITDLTSVVDDNTAAMEANSAAIADLTSVVDDNTAAIEANSTAIEDNTAAIADNTAAIADLSAAIDATNAALDDNTAADADLAGRVDELEAGLGDLAAAVEENTSSITSLNDLTVLLNQDILDLQDQVSSVLARMDDTDAANAIKFDDLKGMINDVDSHLNDLSADVDARFDAVAADIDDLRAYDTVLRSDLDTTIGRVTVVETGLVATNARVTAVSDRVATLETDYGFSTSGSLTYNYYMSALSGRDFDIDRITPGSRLSTGVTGGDNGSKSNAIDYADFGPAINGSDNTVGDVTDFNGFARTEKDGSRSVEGSSTVNLSFSVNFKNRSINGKSGNLNALAAPTNALNVESVTGEFGLVTSGGLNGNATDADTKFTQPLNFYVKKITTNFTVSGTPITLSFGQSPKVKFSDYVFDNDKTSRGQGITATISGSTIAGLGALAPKITLTYGSKSNVNADFGYFSGARAEITTSGITAGLNYATEGGDGISPNGVKFNVANGQTTVMGANLSGTKVFGTGFNLSSEFATSTNTLAASKGESAFYAKLSGDLGPVTIEDANFRTISAGYNAARSLSEADPANGDNGSNAPYAPNQTGFGVKAKITLGGIKVGGYFDQQTDYNNVNLDSNDDVTKFGANVEATFGSIALKGYYDDKADKGTAAQKPNKGNKLGASATLGSFSGFTLSANYDMVSLDGKTVDVDGTKYLSDPGVANGFGVSVKHEGAASGALIKGLNLNAGYKQQDADLTKTTIDAGGDYTLVAGPLTITPSGSYQSVADSDVKTTGFDGVNAATATDTYTRVKANVGVSTAVLDAPFKPSFAAKVGYYNTDHTNAATGSGVFTAKELSYQITAKFDAFLFDKSTFAATYGSWNGTNRAYTPFLKNADGSFSSGSWGDKKGAFETTLSGYTLEWNLYDVSLAFGDYTLSGNTETNRGQAFRIGYKVTF
jgi:predicted  nucleic acid-binding Zn-ribbon protein